MTIYALLVGIDDYLPPVPKLRGCANDIRQMQEYLTARVDPDGRSLAEVLKVKTLIDREATPSAVIRVFREHLGQAGPDDVALFCYSGHGSQEQAPEQFWAIELDHLDETLVLYDSRMEGSWDLADKELSKLIAEVAGNGGDPGLLPFGLGPARAGSGRDRSSARADRPADPPSRELYRSARRLGGGRGEHAIPQDGVFCWQRAGMMRKSRNITAAAFTPQLSLKLEGNRPVAREPSLRPGAITLSAEDVAGQRLRVPLADERAPAQGMGIFLLDSKLRGAQRFGTRQAFDQPTVKLVH